MSLYSKIRGTIETIFQLGIGGPQLKASAGVIEGRNAADAAYAIVRGDTPVGVSDLTTKAYVDALVSSGALKMIRFALRGGASGAGTADSATALTVAQRVVRCDVIITTPYDGGATISIGQAGFVTAFQTTGDNSPSSANTWCVEQSTIAPAAAAVRMTLGAGSTVGAGFCEVWYSEPNA